MSSGSAQALASCKKLIEHEHDTFLHAKWNAKDSGTMDSFPEDLYRARLAAMDRAIVDVSRQGDTLAGGESVIEGFLSSTLAAIGDSPENIYFLSELRRKLKTIC